MVVEVRVVKVSGGGEWCGSGGEGSGSEGSGGEWWQW